MALHERPPVRYEDDRDNVIVVHGVSWSTYETLLRERDAAECSRPRYSYLDGELEIMTTSPRHELYKKLIARLLEMFAVEMHVELTGVGEATLKDEAKEAGLQPDEWYCIEKYKEVPDIAIEVVYKSGGIDKLEIYRRFGVREVWFWIDGRFWLYRLVKGRYRKIQASQLIPDFDFDEIAAIVLRTKDGKQTTAVRAYQQALRRRQ